MPHPSRAIANSFLDISRSAVDPIDPMKIQKLVYFAHGWHLGSGRGALSSEHAEAWRWGPVFPELYHSVKAWGKEAITTPIHVPKIEVGSFRLHIPRVPKDSFEHNIIKRIWDVYGSMTGLQLSQITHKLGGPWQETRDKGNVVIPNDLIRLYFARKIQDAQTS